jgi:clan AA aspartic protease (TIGR02281 family)
MSKATYLAHPYIKPCDVMSLTRKLVMLVLSACTTLSFSQTIVKMEKVNGVFVMPCEVNGLGLKFVFDTGASDVSISLTEALFMLKNGYLKESDLIGTEYYQIANGDVLEGTKIRLSVIKIGDRTLTNVEASIVHSLSAPLLLGQSALKRLGTIQFDYASGTLTILNGSSGNSSGAAPRAFQSLRSPPTPSKGNSFTRQRFLRVPVMRH